MLHVSLPPSFRRASPLLPPTPPPDPSSSPPMAINLRSHAFAGNPLRSSHPPPPLLLADNLKGAAFDSIKVLSFRKGRVLARSEESSWRLCWLRPSELGANWPADASVFLGADRGGTGHWAVDISRCDVDLEGGGVGRAFVELRTLMVATDWADESLMAELAVAGHAKALIEWHATSRFCGHCGARTKTIDAGKRKQCTEESCKKRVYPRVDPVVIMLVIDKENDRALLSHQARFVPRMWSCLAGFIEPGESLEEAVRRETLEETGIEVGKVVYHSSQPWPVGPSSMPCQLMVGFFAYAKSFDIKVDKKELDDARWYSKEDIRKALTFTEYERAQKTSALKVKQMCQGIQRDQSPASDLNVDSGELAPMFVPGPYAIAHHLISSWVHNDACDNDLEPFSASSTSLSNL